MKLKTVSAACLASTLSIGMLPTLVFAQTYTYGDKLDIKRVLTLSEDESLTCNVVGARMSYLDSNDQMQILEYRKLAAVCSQGS